MVVYLWSKKEGLRQILVKGEIFGNDVSFKFFGFSYGYRRCFNFLKIGVF